MLVGAAALGLFAVAGSTRALASGFSFLPAWLIVVIAAVGGGSLRHVFGGRAPRVFERGEPHAVVAALVAIFFLVTTKTTGNEKTVHICRDNLWLCDSGACITVSVEDEGVA